MVKRPPKFSTSEDDAESIPQNQNKKRVKDDENEGGKKKQKTFGLYRQPTVQELNRLQETESLFNSNLFRLQVDEILQEVKLKEKTEKKFTEWFVKFKTYLLEIPDDDTEYDLTEPTLLKKLKVKIPVSSELNKTKCMFKFQKFTDIEIVGSYRLGCPINSKLKVDIQITVPAEVYTKNDSVNYRYHKKRAAYLAYIASHLSKSDLVEEVNYSNTCGCQTKPILDLKPAGKLGNNLSVKLNLTCESEAYKFHRFSPSRNNLRESWLLSSTTDSSTEVGPPTPYYNSSVLCDLAASINQEFLNELLANSENLKQAIVLLKIWLCQRNIQVSGYVVSLLVAYLVQIKRINNIMSSYQIVRNVWIALKSSEFDTKGITLHKGQAPVPSLQEFHQHFPIVFIDCTGYYNILWQMSKHTYHALRREAALAVDLLDDGKINSFIPLFMTPVKPLLQFDCVIRFKNLQSIKKLVLSKVCKESRLNYGVEELSLVVDTVAGLLARGLGDRLHVILPMVEADLTWPVKKSLEKAKSIGYEEKLSFGLIFNPDTAFNIVEKGPPANLPEAEEFRSFWGDKSELRRFQDGSITETCVWRGHSAVEARTIPKQIVHYLLQLKYGIPSTEVFVSMDQMSSMTASRSTGRHVEESSLQVLQAFDSLRRSLRDLDRLPLAITAVYGVSPVFSYSSPLPPGGAPPPRPLAPWAPLPEYTPVCEAVMELGHSGKWPGDIQAFRCLKAAFHLQIADQLAKQYSLPTQAYPTHIDVVQNGLVFRLGICHAKEITLLRKEVVNGVAKYRDTDESVKLHCDAVLMPRLRGALHGVHTKHPAYGPTVVLFKRWLCCHLLSPPLIPTPAAELLCALVFTRPAPLVAPTTPTGGLIRVLDRLAYTDWTSEVVVLDFNEDLTREELTAMEQQLSSDRQPLSIATAYDGAMPGIWSKDVTAPVLARARLLADGTLKYIANGVDCMEDNLLGAFIPSLSGYDAYIRLVPNMVPHSSERVDHPPGTGGPSPAEYHSVPVVEFHPVLRYLDELRSAYSEFALFFHDLYGGDVIAVLWKPGIHDYKEFQLLSANALMPVTVKGETKYKVNTAALLEDFRIMGQGLVKSVTVS